MPTITINERTLSNGLRVIAAPDHAAPNVTVTVMYRVGSHDEHRGKTGLAHLFEHLMFDNTSTGIDKQYDLYCTKAGGSNNAYTTFDYTTYYINLPSNQAPLGFWLEAERMRDFMISDHALETQRKVVIEEIKQNVENQPYGKWRQGMEETAYEPSSPYSWEVYGSPDDVAGVQMSDAHDFFSRFYRPSNAVLTVAGDIEPERVFALAQEHFGQIPSGDTIKDRTTFDASMCRYGTHHVIQDDVSLPAIYVSFHMPGMLDESNYAAEIAAYILGSGRSSALYKHLVKEKQIASSVGAYFDKRHHASLLTFYVFASSEDITPDMMAAELLACIRGVVVDDVTFMKAVNKARMSLAYELQKNEGVADSICYHTLFYNDPHMVNTLMEKYVIQTKEAVQSMIDACTSEAKWARVDIVPNEELEGA